MGTDLNLIYQLIEQRLKEFRKKSPELGEIITFCERVLDMQKEIQPRISLPPIKLDRERMAIKLREGFPLLQREDLPVDSERGAELLGKLCRIGLDENPVLAEAAKILREAMDASRLSSGILFSAVVHDDDDKLESLAAELRVGRLVLKALAKLSIQPSLAAAALAATKAISVEGWKHRHCPVCGAMPAMAALVGEEGSRRGLCSFCGHLYQLARLGCPFCGAEDPEDLRYFYGEEEDSHRVQVCDRCSGYIKILDTRKEGSVEALAIDDILTAHLDLVAEEQGYERKAPRLWGI
ncbi:MAG TPA: formate dehydrogenase accessory protein FdhE [Syntrophobacteria bacterium]|nr:formate dehydrogenase accessory protein FdhE [Syntrophobacteria bacterium]